MRNVYLVQCVDLNYVCEVCSSLKTARKVMKWYHEVIGKGNHRYSIITKTLLESGFDILFEIPKE